VRCDSEDFFEVFCRVVFVRILKAASEVVCDVILKTFVKTFVVETFVVKTFVGTV